MESTMPFSQNDDYKKHHIDPELRKGFMLDNITVLPNNGEIIRDGARYHLPPKALEILLYLAQHDNKVVSSEDLLEFGWGNSKAKRSNLTHTISEIRHALDDHKECPEFIQTFPRKGYRLISKISALDENIVYPDIWPINTNLSSAQANNSQAKKPWHISLALLRNSKLFSVSIAFVVSTWALLQVFEILFPIFNVPEWGLKLVVLVLVIGFPLILLFTWLKEIKVKGYLSRKNESGKNKPTKRSHFYKQLAIDFSFIGFLSVGVGFIAIYLIESIKHEQDNTENIATIKPLTTVTIKDDHLAVLQPKINGQNLPQYFATTFQGELSNALSKQKHFKVVSPRAVNELSVESQISEFTSQLGARYLLDISLSDINNQLSITFNLIDGKNNLQVWSSQIVGNDSNLLKLQRDANRQVTSAFYILSNVSEEDPLRVIDTENFKAYDSYIQGKQYLSGSIEESQLLVAQKHFMDALSTDPSFTLASAGLCQTYLNIYEVSHRVSAYQFAETQCKKLIDKPNLQEEAFIALGNLNRISGENEIAINYFNQAMKLAPANVEIYSDLSKSYSALGNLVKAEDLLKTTIQLEPGYWKNYLSLGDFYFQQGEYKKASEQYAKITLLRPNDAQAFNRLGAAFYLNYQMAQASTAWQQSLMINPSANIYSNLATSYFFAQDFKQAEKNYQFALELKPDDAILWANLGDAQKYIYSKSYAKPAFEKALQLVSDKLLINPNDTESLSEQARYYSELNSCEQANQITQKLVSQKLNDPYGFYALALTSLNCGNQAQAKKFTQSAISLGYPKELIELDIQFESIKPLSTRRDNNENN